jgi:methanethiol oxidase
VLGKKRTVKGRDLNAGPQMLNLSLDGKRLYMTNSLYSTWDNQFYPDFATKGSYLMQFDCNLTVNENSWVDFAKEPTGPVRAHEIRFPDGDCTSGVMRPHRVACRLDLRSRRDPEILVALSVRHSAEAPDQLR